SRRPVSITRQARRLLRPVLVARDADDDLVGHEALILQRSLEVATEGRAPGPLAVRVVLDLAVQLSCRLVDVGHEVQILRVAGWRLRDQAGAVRAAAHKGVENGAGLVLGDHSNLTLGL